MKHVLPVILITLLYSSSYANHCSYPLDEFAFDRKVREIRSSRSDRFRFRNALNLVREYCLTSTQVKSIAESFQDEEFKLRFSLRAYDKVFDPDNFYDVYDAFTSFSMAFRLHDILHELIPNPYIREVDDRLNDVRPRRISFPDLDYPKTTSYNGLIGCDNIVDNQLFADLAYSLSEKRSEEAKLKFMVGSSKKKCLSMAQAMKLATLFDKEVNALIMLKAYLHKIYDMENFGAARALFTSRYLKKEWMDYSEYVVSSRLPPAQVIDCKPTQVELSQIRASLRKKHFPKEKLDLARLLVKDHCFSVSQIRGLMKEFTFSNYKMEFAKIAYGNCLDPHNYYQLLDELTFPSEKRELRRYMEANQVST